jgi:hypothetical protein
MSRPEVPSGFRPTSRDRLVEWAARVDRLLAELGSDDSTAAIGR